MEFAEFAEQRGASLLRLAYVLSSDRHLAEDLTQTVLADAYRHWAKVSGARDSDAYVRRMLVNAHLSWRRRRSSTERPVEVGERDAGISPDHADAVADRAAFRAQVDGLAPRARAVLVLRYWSDLSDEAIAEAMGVAPSTVRATAARALATLRSAAAEEREVPR